MLLDYFGAPVLLTLAVTLLVRLAAGPTPVARSFRQVTILPEIVMPGHFLAALAAYPKFSYTGGPFEVRTRWGVHSEIL